MSKNRKYEEVYLTATVLGEALAFDAPEITDEEFKAQLIQHIYEDIPCIRSGTNSDIDLISSERRARRSVEEAITLVPSTDRNRVITEAYNKCWDAKPTILSAYRPSKFLEGSDYDKWAKNELKPA